MYFTLQPRFAIGCPIPTWKPSAAPPTPSLCKRRSEKGNFDANPYQSNYRVLPVWRAEADHQRRCQRYCTNYYYAGRGSNPYSKKLEWQMQNIDKARIRGVSSWRPSECGQVGLCSWGLKLFGLLGYAKSKLSGDNSLLSTQPLKVIACIDYESPSENGACSPAWPIRARKRSKTRNTPKTRAEDPAKKWKITRGWTSRLMCSICTAFYKLNGKPDLRAGVYIKVQPQYTTWDFLRGLHSYSTTNPVDRDGKGLDRYRALP